MSLRTPKIQAAYRKALDKGKKFNPSAMKIIEEFDYWVIVKNEYPYDKIASVHHLLAPKREVKMGEQLELEEAQEAEKILNYYAKSNYDACIMNFPRHQSVPSWYHIHLLEYK